MRAILLAGVIVWFLVEGTAAAQQSTTTPPTSNADLKQALNTPSRTLADGEECDEFVTGQFYFKICRDVITDVPVQLRRWNDERCVIYDPEKCCNVIVTHKVPEDYTEIRPMPVPREEVFCKQFKIRLSEVENLPDCKCPPSEFLNGNGTHSHAGNPSASTATITSLRNRIADLENQLAAAKRAANRVSTARVNVPAPDRVERAYVESPSRVIQYAPQSYFVQESAPVTYYYSPTW